MGLERFQEAQATAYAAILDELRSGRKRTHWMWFIFPQLAGLGHSPTARLYAIANRQEAQDYLAHPVLGARLRDCTETVLQHDDRKLSEIFGFPDDLKFRSCMTLFAQVSRPGSVFEQALECFCGGEADQRTLELLKKGPEPV
jgi:uncharacterized protein (DUF1810 family)